ncbi:gustatory receptor for sugar taste 64e-like, partial [Tenebrio molitor]|uniref:gustatory receptor for sugar taste 64e-like n=1 Tax=Tenebrio molitor TaxID=7067 RepID=UPI00362495DC
SAGYVDSFVITGTTDILQFNFYSFIFNYIAPNYILAVIYLFVYSIHFFVINFNDIFIILTSMAIALRFQQIGNRLEMTEKSQSHAGMVDFWLEMRQDYDRLSHLCKDLDDGISGLILVSFAYNMFFVIIYLFHHLMVENDESQIIMFYWFFPCLVLRVFAVCLYTSWLNDESLTPLTVLNSVVSRDYNSEIGRWLVQMSFDDVALTGGKIFKITRSIFLSVVSIVVTYELVVMQFHGFSTKTESGR